MKGGLQKLPKDNRDFKLGKIFTLPDPEQLPEQFDLGEVNLKHQRNSDFCTQFGACGSSELQERLLLEPSYSFALSKAISGDVEKWGQDLRTAMKTHQKFGAIEKDEAPYSLENKSPDFLRRIENWPDGLKELAARHRKKSYFRVMGPNDHFDDLRASIYAFREQMRAPLFGMLWNYPMDQVYIDEPVDEGFGHAMYAIGWEGEYLKAVQSYGKDAGENGKHYIHRRVINANADDYGAYMFIDINSEHIKKYKWTWYQKFINFIQKLWMDLT